MPCKNGGSCFNKPGSFECFCRKGYQGKLCEKGEAEFFTTFQKYVVVFRFPTTGREYTGLLIRFLVLYWFKTWIKFIQSSCTEIALTWSDHFENFSISSNRKGIVMVEAKNYRAQSDSRVGLWANFKGRQKLDVSSRPREVYE